MAQVRLNDDIMTRLKHLADETGRSMSFYIREAVESKLEDLEDIYLAEKALEDIRAGNDELVSWEDVKKELNL
ncbi:CopG family transcriptional regulator [Francisella halioticida]|uniref:type II toxin-antitoxin system RelB family antitoxin n=1 Tax=Francisella halioticida TaxID=549298 RepID=UPI001AF80CED|nr:DUF6290 family protein [Francisella halioticida]BCD92274.1 CopG family transcriptional regulator [Francisella halioticida]